MSENRRTITVIACVNANGDRLPPHVIIPGKTKASLRSYDTQNAGEEIFVSVSDSGWIKEVEICFLFRSPF